MTSFEGTQPSVTWCAFDADQHLGGTASWLQRLVPSLLRSGIRSRVLLLRHTDKAGPTETVLRACGVDVVSAVAMEFTESRMDWMLAEFRKCPTPVFVPNEVLAGYYLTPTLKAAGVSVIGVLHSDCDDCIAWQDLFVSGDRDYRLNALVAVSEVLTQQVRERGVKELLLRRIPCGVPIPQVSRVSAGHGLRLVYVGRLTEEAKRVSLLTSSLCDAVEQIPGCTATLIGDGPSRCAVESIVAGRNCARYVSLAGRLDPCEVAERLLQTDIIVLLSDYEGLPVSLMEAMAAGVVPVCLKSRSGIPELVTSGLNGFIVADRQSGFLDAIRQLNDDRQLLERMSDQARRRIIDGFSDTNCVRSWYELIGQLGDSNEVQMGKTGIRKLPPVHPLLLNRETRRPRKIGRLESFVRRAHGTLTRMLR